MSRDQAGSAQRRVQTSLQVVELDDHGVGGCWQRVACEINPERVDRCATLRRGDV